MEVFYDGSLEGLFAILDRVSRGAPLPDRICRLSGSGSLARPGKAGRGIAGQTGLSPAMPSQPELFEETPCSGSASRPGAGDSGSAALADPLAGAGGGSFRPGPAGEFSHPLGRELFELSADAFWTFIHAWMSEYPIEGEIIRFGWRVLAAGRNAGAILGIASPEARAAAERITTDRGDRGTERVLRAAYKTGHEIHRLMGFLRFTRDARGRYLARCAPDHFILPGLASHFTRRFGAATWAIIDEKRDLILLGPSGEVPRLFPIKTGLSGNTPLSLVPPAAGTPPQADPWVPQADPWEELWRNYHHAINNEDRKNPGLQRRFMPLRYWKYLPEMNFGASPRGDPCAAPIDTSQKGGP